MAMPSGTTGLTYEDLQAFPEDNLRRELIDGELVVTAAPNMSHQAVVRRLVQHLGRYGEEHGGEAFPAPLDVYLAPETVLEPDVLFVRAENIDASERRFVRGAPDVVIEVSSPTTRRLELLRKKEAYERFRVPEYWYVDLDAERIEVYRLGEAGYDVPELLTRSDLLESALLPEFSLAVDYILGPPLPEA